MKKEYREMAEAFTIFAKYDTGWIQGEHDEIFAGPNPKDVSADDRKRLKQLGWSKHDGDGFRYSASG